MSRERDDLGMELSLLGFEPEVPFTGLSGRRRWRWDWAIVQEEGAIGVTPDGRTIREYRRVAVEYQGVMRTAKGSADPSHASIAGMLRDHEKCSEGQLCGWIVLLVNAKTVENGKAMEWVLRALGEYNENGK